MFQETNCQTDIGLDTTGNRMKEKTGTIDGTITEVMIYRGLEEGK